MFQLLGQSELGNLANVGELSELSDQNQNQSKIRASMLIKRKSCAEPQAQVDPQYESHATGCLSSQRGLNPRHPSIYWVASRQWVIPQCVWSVLGQNKLPAFLARTPTETSGGQGREGRNHWAPRHREPVLQPWPTQDNNNTAEN